METILITGANRGLGLEFTRQYASIGANILACCRVPAEAQALQALKKTHTNIQLFGLDVSKGEQIQALAKQIKDPIDILINNAGQSDKSEAWGNLSSDKFLQTFLVNSVAPLKITEAFSEHVAKSQRKLIVCISSIMGSLSENIGGGYYSYRASKAALNMAMKSAAIDLEPQHIKILLLHPGWVKTRMGGESASIDAVESITGMRKVIDQYQPAPGEVKFYRYDGKTIGW